MIIDFETRSRCDLKKCGEWVYAFDPSTEVLCVAIGAKLWVPEKFRFLLDGVTSITDFELCDTVLKNELVAHNASFERAIWEGVLVRKHHFPALPVTKWDCTAARAAAMGLPRDLAGAASELRLPQQKDKVGQAVMMRMCKPKKDGTWNEDRADFNTLVRYCLQDVATEAELHRVLPKLSEREVWLADQTINERGVLADTASCAHVVSILEQAGADKLSEFRRLTKGQVMSPRQVARLLSFLAESGVELPNLRKETVAGTVAEGDVKAILELRSQLGKSAVAKYQAVLSRSGADNRCRGMFMYHGAATGRWAGKGIQPHNMLRKVHDNPDMVFRSMALGYEAHKAFSSEDPYVEASQCCRAVFMAAEGKTLLIADYSAIEGRVLAWLAGEDWVIKAYRDGRDMYKEDYAAAKGVRYEDVDKNQRQVGKVINLALGYQGAVGAFNSMAKNYGVTLPEQEIKQIVKAWRAARPATVRFWYSCQDAAIEAVLNPGKDFRVGKVVFRSGALNGVPFLTCILPSGRRIRYCNPSLMDDERFKDKKKLCYWSTKEGRWQKIDTYGGSLCENITQAVARDILAGAIVGCENASIPVVLHVHDEIVAESTADNLDKFKAIMTAVPEWAEGLPLEVKAFTSKRYGKE